MYLPDSFNHKVGLAEQKMGFWVNGSFIRMHQPSLWGVESFSACSGSLHREQKCSEIWANVGKGREKLGKGLREETFLGLDPAR